MKDFVMTHPWMTFWLIALAFCIVDNVIGNICKAASKAPPPKETDEHE